jgi:hypothetical protein
LKYVITVLVLLLLLCLGGYYWLTRTPPASPPDPAAMVAVTSDSGQAAVPRTTEAEISQVELRIQQLMLHREEMDSAQYEKDLADEKELLANLKNEAKAEREKINLQVPPKPPVDTAATAAVPAPAPRSLPALFSLEGGFILILAGIIILVIIIIIVLIKINRRRAAYPEEEPEENQPPPPPPAAAPDQELLSMIKSGTGSHDLKKTIENFTSQKKQFQIGESGVRPSVPLSPPPLGPAPEGDSLV